MKRREFIAGLGSAAAWPLAVRAQQSKMPVIGYLSPSRDPGVSPEPFREGLREIQTEAFLKGLAEAGYVEGRNVAIEYRWVGGHNERLPALLSDLIGRRVAVLAVVFLERNRLISLVARRAIPAVYSDRYFLEGGGSVLYTGRILNGEKPGDLPVQQITKIELGLNLKTAKTLGITFPTVLLTRADEVIE
jgi:putative tryptophan/tyrosine transport system substrate-binding protein